MGPKLPHLFHTPESGELTLTLDHLKTNFNKSRFAVELLTISSYPYNKSEEITVDTFSDDKLSGGTFLVSSQVIIIYKLLVKFIEEIYLDNSNYF